MIDFFFAVIAAGINSTGGDGQENTAVVLATPTPAPVEAPVLDVPVADAAPEASIAISPSVSIGENVQIGENVIIGGNALNNDTLPDSTLPESPLLGGTAPNASTAQGGLSLLEGTTESVVQPAAATSRFNMSVVPAGLVADPQAATGKFTTAAEIKPIMNATKGNWVAVREYEGQDLLYISHIWGWRCGLKAMAISVNGEAMQNWPLPPCHMEYAAPNAVLEEDGLPYLRMKLGAVQTIDIQIVYDDLSMDAASFERGNVLIP